MVALEPERPSENTARVCKACGSSRVTLDEREGRYGLAICAGCGLRSIAEPETIIDLSVEQSESDYLLSYSTELRRVAMRRLRLVRDIVPRGASGLDFGASFGTIAESLRESGYAMSAFEKSERALASLSKRSFDTFDDIDALPIGRYDFVTMWHVLEHLKDPFESVGRISQSLRPGGALLIAVPNARGLFARARFESWIWTMPWHLHYFSVGSIKALLQRCGLEFVSVTTDTGDVAALEVLLGGLFLGAPSRLSSRASDSQEAVRSSLRKAVAPALRSICAPVQYAAKFANLGEELVIYAKAP